MDIGALHGAALVHGGWDARRMGGTHAVYMPPSTAAGTLIVGLPRRGALAPTQSNDVHRVVRHSDISGAYFLVGTSSIGI